VLARAAPMTPAQGADEDGTRGPMNRPKGNNSRGGEEVSCKNINPPPRPQW
jgi:hypothetical protein